MKRKTGNWKLLVALFALQNSEIENNVVEIVGENISFILYLEIKCMDIKSFCKYGSKYQTRYGCITALIAAEKISTQSRKHVIDVVTAHRNSQ